MPFILVHPAAALPLHRYLGRHAVLSALIIGSMTPDMHYFLPLAITRGEAHSLDGLLWFCLPIGVALYLLYHFILKCPLRLLLPLTVRLRLRPWLNPGHLPAASWKTVSLSLLIGAMTHLIWDAFTHQYAAGTLALPVLRATWLSLGHYKVPGYEVLQQLSNLLGFFLLSFWASRWLQLHSPMDSPSTELSLSPVTRRSILVGVTLAAFLFAFIKMQQSPPLVVPDLLELHIKIKEATVAAMSGGGLVLLAYSVGWQLQARWRRILI